MSSASSRKTKRSPVPSEPSSGPVALLMAEYFELKDKGKAMRESRANFMANRYVCANQHTDDEGVPYNCIDTLRQLQDRGHTPTKPIELCGSCSIRYKLYTDIKTMQHRRTAIMNIIRAKLKANP